MSLDRTSFRNGGNAHTGGGQGFRLQSLTSPLGFMLDLLQKLLWTILLSTFRLQPYRRYCFPAVRGDGAFEDRYERHRQAPGNHSTVPPPQGLEQ